MSFDLLACSKSKGNPFHNELSMPNNFHGSTVEVVRGGVHVCAYVCDGRIKVHFVLRCGALSSLSVWLYFFTSRPKS